MLLLHSSPWQPSCKEKIVYFLGFPVLCPIPGRSNPKRRWHAQIPGAGVRSQVRAIEFTADNLLGGTNSRLLGYASLPVLTDENGLRKYGERVRIYQLRWAHQQIGSLA